MHAYILTTTDPEIIAEKIIEILGLTNFSSQSLYNQPDIIMVKPGPSITIGQIRHLQRQLTHKPLKLPKQVGIILEAQTMTLPAQNAFLKLLEEPTQDTIFCLATVNPYQLLPTVLSRAQILTISESHSEKTVSSDEFFTSQSQLFAFLSRLQQANIGQRLKLVEPYALNREKVQAWTLAIITTLERVLLSLQSEKQLTLGEILVKTLRLHQALKNNVNPKLALDNWALSL